MDKSTLSNYGLILVATMIIAAMLVVFSPISPFGFADKIEDSINTAVQKYLTKTEIEEIPDVEDENFVPSGNSSGKRTIIIKHVFANGQDAAASESIEVAYGETFDFNAAVKTNINGHEASSVPAKQIIVKNAEFSIVYTPKTYTIKYNVNGGTIISSAINSYKYGETTVLPLVVTKTGYDFMGWYEKSDFTGGKQTEISSSSFGNKEFYAKWSAKTVSITYKTGNTVLNLQPDKVEYGSNTTQSLPTATDIAKIYTNPGYDFVGWYTTQNFVDSVHTRTPLAPTKDIVYYAKWKSNLVYTISFNLNGGAFINGYNKPEEYIFGNSTLLPTGDKLEKKGYRFDGWYSDADFTYKITSISSTDKGNKTFYAKWTPVIYNISYDFVGGSLSNPPETFKITDNFQLPEPNKTGYTFAGWKTTTGTNITHVSSNYAEDLSLIAQWTPNRYPLVLMDGDNVYKTVDAIYGNAYKDLTNITKEGYDFLGWYDNNGQQFTASDIYLIADEQTLYAKWQAKSYELTYKFYDNNGNLITTLKGNANISTDENYLKPIEKYCADAPQTLLYNTLLLEEIATPQFVQFDITTIDTYVWFKSPEFTRENLFTEEDIVTGDTTLYCQLTPIEFAISYDTEDCIIEDVNNYGTYTYGKGEGNQLPIAVKDGYIFKGWYVYQKATDENNVTVDIRIGRIDATENYIPEELYGDVTLVPDMEETQEEAVSISINVVYYFRGYKQITMPNGKRPTALVENIYFDTPYEFEENAIFEYLNITGTKEEIDECKEYLTNHFYHDAVTLIFRYDPEKTGIEKTSEGLVCYTTLNGDNYGLTIDLKPYIHYEILPVDITTGEEIPFINFAGPNDTNNSSNGNDTIKAKQDTDTIATIGKYSTGYQYGNDNILYEISDEDGYAIYAIDDGEVRDLVLRDDGYYEIVIEASDVSTTVSHLDDPVTQIRYILVGYVPNTTAEKYSISYDTEGVVLSADTNINDTTIFNSFVEPVDNSLALLENPISYYISQAEAYLPTVYRNCNYIFVGWAEATVDGNGNVTKCEMVSNSLKGQEGNKNLVAVWKICTEEEKMSQHTILQENQLAREPGDGECDYRYRCETCGEVVVQTCHSYTTGKSFVIEGNVVKEYTDQKCTVCGHTTSSVVNSTHNFDLDNPAKPDSCTTIYYCDDCPETIIQETHEWQDENGTTTCKNCHKSK